MGQPLPPHGRHGQQGPFPGQPGQQPFPGRPGQPPSPPPGYGQQPPQGPPPGHGQPPQGPPGQYPPGFGSQGPGPGAPKKKTGLIVGVGIGAAVLVVIGGTLVAVSSGGDYLALPDDCSALVGEDVLADVFDDSPPRMEGGYETDTSGFDHFDANLHGVMACTASTDEAELVAHVILFDREHSDQEADMDRHFELEGEGTDLLRSEEIPPGEVTDHEFDMGDGTSQVMWDEPSIGDRSLVIGMNEGGGSDYMSEFGIGIAQQENAIIGVTVDFSGSSAAPDAEGLYRSAEAGVGALAKQVPRVAER